MAVPRDRHKEVLRQTREERMRKIAMLAMQYERTISEMAQQQTVSDKSEGKRLTVLAVWFKKFSN